MEILYIWINESVNGVLKNLNVNLSPKHNFTMKIEDKNYTLYCEEINKNYNNFFSSDKNNVITNITAIVGENGCGKSTLLKLIMKYGLYSKRTSDENYEKALEKEFLKNMGVIVIQEDDGEKVIVSNLKSGGYEFKTNVTKNIIEIIKWSEETSKIIGDNKYYEGITFIHLTNDSLQDNREGIATKSETMQSIYLNQNTVQYIQNSFYNSLINISHNNKKYQELNKIIKYKKSYKNTQKIFDLFYFSDLKKKNLKSIDEFKFIINKNIETSFGFFHRKMNEYYSEELVQNAKSKLVNKNFYETTENEIKKNTKRICNYINPKLKEFMNESQINILYSNLLVEKLFLLEEKEADCFYYKNIDNEKMVDKKYIINMIKKIKLEDKELNKYYEESLKEVNALDKIIGHLKNETNHYPENDGARKKWAEIEYSESKQSNYWKFIYFINENKVNNSFVLKYLDLETSNLSSGERAFLNFFSWLNSIEFFNHLGISNAKRTFKNIILLIDEIDLYLHPDWQRKFLKLFIEELNVQFKDKEIQVILATHSPIMLSDIPKSNTIFMKDLKIDEKEKHCETFASSIYNLYNDAFFLGDKGSMGELAKERINEIIKILGSKNTDNKLSNDRINELEYTINNIGEPVIKNELLKLLEQYKERFNYESLEKLLIERENIDKKISELNLNQQKGGDDN